MLKKARSPMALVLALIMCISLFSGIVLAEGLERSSDDVWAGIAEDASSEVVIPKEGVLFIDSEAYENVEDTYTYANGVTYQVTKYQEGFYYEEQSGANLFATIDDALAFIEDCCAAVREEVVDSFKNFTFVLAPGTYGAVDLFSAYAGGTVGDTVANGYKLTVLGPKAGEAAFDQSFNLNSNRSADPATEAVFSGVITLNPQTNFTYEFDGIAVKGSGNFASAVSTDAGNPLIYINFRNLYVDSVTAPFAFKGGSTNKLLRDITLEDCYFAMATGFSMENIGIEDLTIDHCYFNGIGASPCFYFIPSLSPACTDASKKDAVMDINVQNSRFNNFQSYGYGNFQINTRSNYSPRANAGGGISLTIDNCEFLNMFFGTNSKAYFIRPVVPTSGTSKGFRISVTNNVFAAKDDTIKTKNVYLLDPTNKGANHLDSVTIENNAFKGLYNIARYIPATNVSNNYFADKENANYVNPTVGTGATFSGAVRYLDSTDLTYTSAKLKLTQVGGAAVSGVTEPTLTAVPGTAFAGTASVEVGSGAAATAVFEDSTITAKVYSDAACTEEITSLDGVTTAYVKGTKTIDGKEVTVTYTVTVSAIVSEEGVYEGDKKFFDPDVSAYADGKIVEKTYNGETLKLKVGTHIFAQLTADNFPAGDDGISRAYFLPETYAGFSVPTNFAIYGAKAGINPNVTNNIAQPNPERANDEGETVVTGTISIPTQCTNITIDGFTLTGAAQFLVSGSNGADFECHATITNCRNSVAEDAYDAGKPNTALVRTYTGGYKDIDLTNNRFDGVQLSTNTSGLIAIRSWMGTASGNYFSSATSNNPSIFWLKGEYQSGSATDHHYDATISDNYIVGRLAAVTENTKYNDFSLKVTGNTFETAFDNASIMDINAASTTKFAAAKIEVSDNVVINGEGVTGASFVQIKGKAAAERTGYVKVTDNDIDLGEDFGYVFGMNTAENPAELIVTATGNTIEGVATAVGNTQSLLTEYAVGHFDFVGDGSKVTTANNVAVNTLPESAAVTGKFTGKVTFVADAQDSYTFTATPNTFVAVLNEDGTVATYNATVALESGVNTFKVLLAPMDAKSSYDASEAVTYTIVKNLATVAVKDYEAKKLAEGDANYNAEKPWATFWSATVTVGNGVSDILADLPLEIVDYGMYYSNDLVALNSLATTGVPSAKALMKSYSTSGKVYKEYSFEFHGIMEDKYRYGQFYITYKLGDGENAVTVTSVSPTVAYLQTVTDGASGTIDSGVTELPTVPAE